MARLPADDRPPRTPRPDAHPDIIATPDSRYNLAGITATDFLLAVMHDKKAPLSVRIDAAARLMEILPERYAPMPPFVERELWPGEKKIVIVIETPEPLLTLMDPDA